MSREQAGLGGAGGAEDWEWRIRSVLDSHGLTTDSDGSGTIGCLRDGHLFRICCLDAILSARVRWQRSAAQDSAGVLRALAADWNSRSARPAVQLAVWSGRVTADAVYRTDLTGDLSDRQLGGHLRTIIDGSLEFFALLEEQVPPIDPSWPTGPAPSRSGLPEPSSGGRALLGR